MKIAALADFHYAMGTPPGARRSDLAPLLLRRAVARLNRFVKPDVTVLLGDLLDRGSEPDGSELRGQLAKIVATVESPTIVLPGNHDGDAEAFYRDFERPGPWTDVAGVRLVGFDDPEEPRCWARRTAADIERLRAARSGWDGDIVCLQHLPLHPPGSAACPYNLTNADAAIGAMCEVGARLSIGGHYHRGMDLVERDGCAFVGAPALCEAPFAFLVMEIDGDRITSERQELAMPRELGLFDHHVHTQFSYCGNGMDMATAAGLAKDLGLAGLCFSEHSGQLYFARREYWRGDWYTSGVAGASPDCARVDDYLAATESLDDHVAAGFEVDFDRAGRPVLGEDVLALGRPAIGTIHHLDELAKPEPDLARAAEEFLSLAAAITGSGVRALAHPLRVFRRKGQPMPEGLFEPLVRMLRENGVAAEINFHTNEPPREFFSMCLEAGVRITLGSDAHEHREIGEFWPHLRLLEDLGVSDPRDVLLSHALPTERHSP